MKRIDNQKIMIWVLAILLISAIAYIGVKTYQQKTQEEQLTVYRQGMQAGYEQAIIQLVQQASTCQPVPINIQNQTINMIAVECLQQSPGLQPTPDLQQELDLPESSD